MNVFVAPSLLLPADAIQLPGAIACCQLHGVPLLVRSSILIQGTAFKEKLLVTPYWLLLALLQSGH